MAAPVSDFTMRLLACLAVLMLSACARNSAPTPGSNTGASAESIAIWEQKRALCQKQIEEKQYGTVESVCQDALVAGRQIKGIQSLVSSGLMVQVSLLMGTSEATRYKLDAALSRQPPPTPAGLATGVSVAKSSGLAQADEEAIALVSRTQCTVPPGKTLPTIQMGRVVNFESGGHTERSGAANTPAATLSPLEKKER